MADLIDRQALMAALKEQKDRCPLTYLWGLDKAITTANKLSTVDAVEVVRCRNCMYWQSGENEAEKWEYCKFHDIDIGPYSFCSYGERREEND